MRETQSAQDTLPGRGEVQRRLPSVLPARAPLHEAPFGGTLHQLYGAVVLDLQPLSHRSDGRPLLRLQRLEDEQELMLLGLDAGLTSGGLAEREEAADLVAQLRESPVLAGREVRGSGHRNYIV